MACFMTAQRMTISDYESNFIVVHLYLILISINDPPFPEAGYGPGINREANGMACYKHSKRDK